MREIAIPASTIGTARALARKARVVKMIVAFILLVPKLNTDRCKQREWVDLSFRKLVEKIFCFGSRRNALDF